jgi:hypothetical protein
MKEMIDNGGPAFGMRKHTPGPWIYYADLPSDDPNWHIVTTANKMRVLANVHIEPGNLMDEANARLIAAAPDLLAALKNAVAQLERLGSDGLSSGAIDALAKAEGR